MTIYNLHDADMRKPPQPQQEYIITEEDIQILEDTFGVTLIMPRSRPHTSTPNPCEEQGCTDTEQCDEICEHSRIYSPAWVKEHDTAIRNSTLDEFYLRIKAERDPSLEYVDWDSIEAVFIRTQQEKP